MWKYWYRSLNRWCLLCIRPCACRCPGTFWCQGICRYSDGKVQNPYTIKTLIENAPNPKTQIFLVSSCVFLCTIHWSEVLIREWRCSSSTHRQCSSYVWVINNSITHQGTTYVRGLTIFVKDHHNGYYWGADENLAVLITKHWNTSKLKCASYSLTCHLNALLKVSLMIYQHWFRRRLSAHHFMNPSQPRWLTHSGRVMHIFISELTTIGACHGFLPGHCQDIIWTNAWILLIGPLGTNFSEILIEIHIFSFKKAHLKISFVKLQPFCIGLNALIKLAVLCYSNHIVVQHGHSLI